MNNSELVTVCITTYNRAHLIEDAINNVFKQTYQNIELIIVDDSSTDQTEDICLKVVTKLSLQSRNVKYIRHPHNKGLSSARNTAIVNATGKYFTFIDDDDIWESIFIQDFVNLANNYNSDWCFCCGSKTEKNASFGSELIPTFDGPLKDYFKQGYTPPVASQFYFLETLVKVNGYREDVKTCVDHDLWLSLAIANVNLKGLAKALAIPNDDVTVNRMTTNPQKRLNGLTATLQKWEPIITSNFGKPFFIDFSTAYQYRERRKFLFIIFAREGINEGLKYYSRNKDVFTFIDLSKALVKLSLLHLGINLKLDNSVKYFAPTLNIKPHNENNVK